MTTNDDRVAEAEVIEEKQSPETGLVVRRAWEAPILDLFRTAGTLVFSKEEKKALYAPIDPVSIQIRPDGLIYLPWIEYTKRLNAAFGGAAWALIPQTPEPIVKGTLVMWGFHFVIKGTFIGYAFGEQQYLMTNKTMSWGDACAATKSNALMRVCKDLGIALDLWSPDFGKEWKRKYAETYICQTAGRYQGKRLWRKKGTAEADLKEETTKMLVEMFGKDFGDNLETITGFQQKGGAVSGGKRSLDKLSVAELDLVYKRVLAEFSKTKPKGGEKK